MKIVFSTLLFLLSLIFPNQGYCANPEVTLYRVLKAWVEGNWSTSIKEWNSLRATKALTEEDLFHLRIPRQVPHLNIPAGFGADIFSNERVIPALSRGARESLDPADRSIWRVLERRLRLQEGSIPTQERHGLTSTTALKVPSFEPFQRLGCDIGHHETTLLDFSNVRHFIHAKLDLLELKHFSQEGISDEWEEVLRAFGAVDGAYHRVVDALAEAITRFGAEAPNADELSRRALGEWYKDITPLFDDLTSYLLWVNQVDRITQEMGEASALGTTSLSLKTWLEQIQKPLFLKPFQALEDIPTLQKIEALNQWRTLLDQGELGKAVEYLMLERIGSRIGHLERTLYNLKVKLARAPKLVGTVEELNALVIQQRKFVSKRIGRFKLSFGRPRWEAIRYDTNPEILKLIPKNPPFGSHDTAYKRMIFLDHHIKALFNELESPQESLETIQDWIRDIKEMANDFLPTSANLTNTFEQNRAQQLLDHVADRGQFLADLELRYDLAEQFEEVFPRN